MISFCCQQCSREYKVDDKYGGRKARCKQCNHYNVIPVAKPPAEKAQPEETVSFACDACGQKLRVKRIYVGKRVKCSSCGEPCTIPHPQIQASADQASESPAIEKAPPAAPAAKKVSFNCLMCSARMQADESQAGEVIECPKCQCYVEVPGKPEETPAEEESYEDWENRPAPEEDYMPIGTSVSSPRPSRKKTFIPAAWKIPAAIGTGLAFTLGGAIVWAIIAAITGFQFSLIIIAVGGLAGVGLTLYTEERNAMLGVIAVLIGLFGMIMGKALVVKYAVMPEIRKEVRSGSGDEIDFLDFSPESKYALCISSCMEKSDKGEIPEELVWPVFGIFIQAKIQELPENTPPDEQLSYWAIPILALDRDVIVNRAEEIGKGVQGVSEYMKNLTDKQKRTIIASHKKEVMEAYTNLATTTSIAYIGVFVSSFGIFDLIFIPIGLITAFNVGSGRKS